MSDLSTTKSATSSAKLDRRPSSNTTPLWIIGSFVSVSEVVAGVTVINTSGAIQAAALAFMAIFTFFIAGAFFTILWKRSEVLFPPEEFRNVSIKEFVSHVGSGRENRQKRLVEQVVKDVALDFNSEENKGSPLNVDNVKWDLVQTLDSVSKNFIEIIFDNTFQKSGNVTPVSLYVSDWGTVTEFLNDVYFAADDAGIRLPPFKYGTVWFLQRKSGERLPIEPFDMHNLDNRPFEVLEVVAGDTLIAYRKKVFSA